ncbi:uncharacterized protein C19orf47 [Orussus abietinus]|uniref:uncharacterized protein C19orf47 n=1 Tax=Orussus abietinus TaxID=222816 RepID=UPI00062673FB|nr:uncharacterized protein C19orf47 [Orussus abietinus]XP_012278662.1 uncharacterized protein C19orf47 [Orussus abietinus]
MSASLSAYWVKFFKGAGFPQDVATKHAVVFSNNRIKPDMLPDLDKPSLKDMGISLMGDMIAILRYAKKVVEETTCERFLVDTEDDPPTPNPKPILKPTIKKVVTKVPSKNISSIRAKSESQIVEKTIKAQAGPTKSIVVRKKELPSTERVVSHSVIPEKPQLSLKRKVQPVADDYDEEGEDWSAKMQKRLKESVDNNVGYCVTMPKGTTLRSQKILKKAAEQKRTVFDRLGDSSVTSTTNLAESTTTFNVTGLGKDIFKRNSSVFNRLGDKDAKKDESMHAGILKDGVGSPAAHGILKARTIGSATAPIIRTKKILNVSSKPTGTMRADQEVKQHTLSKGTKQLITTKKVLIDQPKKLNIVRRVATSSKLASEHMVSVPAKARLGVTGSTPGKQVTFNRIATVAHIKKPGVFSRLGM